MADIFEARAELDRWRARLWVLDRETPWLDWLLLTKRPQNIARKVPWGQVWPQNVWIGTTVENQQFAKKRLPHLLKHPAVIRFVSAEPLLGPLNLSEWLKNACGGVRPIDWLIVGGESGAKARPMDPIWVEQLRDQCVSAGVAFHFKQWGHWGPACQTFAKKVREARFEGLQGSRTVFRKRSIDHALLGAPQLGYTCAS
jgi:protein gp37